ncbi:helix-turn-helix domain-containing protein [Nocardia sp. NBC_00511]|uniref:helix-turn-helix domain-containing protein n=1 Tax=Nocardia sp. NBC_00511 TaxID=2903591 RepID=UPI0030E1FEA0
MAAGSTVPRRLLGRQLKQLREKSGVPQAEACRLIEIAPQTLWRIESGQPGPKLKEIYIEALCRLYRATPEDAAALSALVAETKSPGWWHTYGDVVPTYFDLYLGLEESARRLTSLHLGLLPGLLQTPEYRRAVVWAAFPGMASSEVESRVEIASKRQARLRESPELLTLTMYLGEAALRYRLGGAGVMADQLRHIAEVSELPAVTVRALPLKIENPLPVITGSFTLMEFPSHPTSRLTEPPVVYIEGFTGALYLDKPGEIDEYRLACKVIRSVAMDERETRQLIEKLAKEFEK